MEPERDIEKELRACAQQRRAEAGPPRELHPTTRKLLQDEAARLAKSPAAPSAPNPLSAFWLRFAFAGCTVLALALAIWIIFPGFSTDKKTEANRTRLAMARTATDVPVKKSLKSESPATPPVFAPRRREIAAPANESAAPAPAVPATVAAMPPPVASPAPDYPAFKTNLNSSLGFTSPSSGLFGGPPPAVSNDRGYALYSADLAGAPVVQSFRRANPPQDANNPAGYEAILGSFRVEQALQKLRVIDSDGSVYNGFVERTPESAGPADALDKELSKQAEHSASPAETPRLYRFRVSGTNRTFREEVVFIGTFLDGSVPPPAPALATSNEPSSRGGVAPAVAEPPPLEMRNARLEGSALLGGSNKIDINAVPVKP